MIRAWFGWRKYPTISCHKEIPCIRRTVSCRVVLSDGCRRCCPCTVYWSSFWSLSLRPFEARIPDSAPVRNNIIGLSSDHADSSLGDTSKGCTTNSRPYRSAAVEPRNATANAIPTIRISRALISELLSRFMGCTLWLLV